MFRPFDNGGLKGHAEMLFRMIFEPYSTEPARRSVGYTFSDFWMEALKTTIPGYQEVVPGDLGIT